MRIKLVNFLMWLIDVLEANYRWTCPVPGCQLRGRSNCQNVLKELEEQHMARFHPELI